MRAAFIALAARLRAYLTRHRLDEDLLRDCEAHIEQLTTRNIRGGMTPEEARAAAVRQFGNATILREDIYRMNRLDWLVMTRDLNGFPLQLCNRDLVKRL